MYISRLYIPSVFENCYLLADEPSGAAAVIDPGAGDAGTLDAIARWLERDGLALRYIFLTHGHYDHVGGVTALRAAYPDVKVLLHGEDAGGSTPLLPTAALGEITLWRDGEVVPLGGLNVEVLHTPGHTRGSVCLKCRDALFTGDTLFAGSMGRTDFPGGSDTQMMASLRRLAALEGDLRVLPGHEGETTLGREREENAYMKLALGS